MKYTREQLEGGYYFIVIEDLNMLDHLIEKYDLHYLRQHVAKREITSISFEPGGGWMGDSNGKYYKREGYTQVFLHELGLEDCYEIC